jgi:6-pyruvoyltetrahydropterin/6-carboxytetrahydropterin synthase
MISCTRRLSFSAGHRVAGHENKCANLHGHNYTVEITAIANELDKLDRVIDFSVLKEKIGGWIDSNIDHGFIISQEDGDVIKAISSITGSKLFIMPGSTTAESIAKHLLEDICPMLLRDTNVKIIKVIVQETENCKAEATL